MDNLLRVHSYPVQFAPDAPNLLSDQGRQLFIAELVAVNKMMLERHGIPLGLLVIDTAAAGLSIEDENSNSDANRATRAMREIADALQIAVLCTHHLGKDAQKGLRGASALKANSDFVLIIPKDGVLVVDKAKDAPSDVQIGHFTLPVVDVGTKDDGRPITSRYVEEKLLTLADFPDLGEAPAEPRKLSKPEKTFADAYAAQRGASEAIEGAPPGAVRVETLRGEFLSRYPGQKPDTAQRKWREVMSQMPPGFSQGDFRGVHVVWAVAANTGADEADKSG